MNKQELTNAFHDNHIKFVDYVSTLTDEEFVYHLPERWSAGQQLLHVQKTLGPLGKGLMSKEYILEKFGRLDREAWDIERIKEKYTKSSRKSPERYVPEEVSADQRSSISAALIKSVNDIKQLMDSYSEEELDTLALPQPLLGLLSIREMFYVMCMHPLLHLSQVRKALLARGN